MPELVIHGCAKTADVWIGDRKLDISPSLLLENKSPSGFAWGYHGSGPAQLALAILLELCDQATAMKLYQKFKVDIIAAQDIDKDLVLPVETVKQWVSEQNINEEEEGV